HSSSTPPIRLMSSSTIKKGETYTASVWIKSNSVAGTSANANILIYDMPSQASLASSSRIPNSNQCARLSATYTNDTGSDLEQITAYFYLNRNPGEETYVTSPKVELGSVATPWTPAPEDNYVPPSDQ